MIDLENYKTEYFGLRVITWKVKNHPYPWRFSVDDCKNKPHVFGGIPNYCESKRSALKRAWYRAKWFSDGSYYSRYK